VHSRTFLEIRKLRAGGLELVSAHEAMLLLTLLDEGPIAMSHAARVVGISRAAMTSMVDRLERMSLVNRAVSADDRRITDIGLSKKGYAAVIAALDSDLEA